MQQSYQPQQLLMMGATIFISITAAVIVSTLVIMSLMRGEIASALDSHSAPQTPVATQTAATCATPQEEPETTPVSTPAAPSVMTTQFITLPPAPVHHVSNTSTTTNNITNTEVTTNTTIRDSFNDNSRNSHNTATIIDSFNPIVIRDNTVNVNSHNNTAVNSGNTTTTNTAVTNTTDNTRTNMTTVNSNNTVENHVLSDNTVVVAPLV